MQGRLLDVLEPDDAARRLNRRFAIINVWRTIRGTVWNSPLALCDASTLAPGDLVAILEALKQAGALRAELVVI